MDRIDAQFDGYAAAIPSVGEVLRTLPDPQGQRSWWQVTAVVRNPAGPQLIGPQRPESITIELGPWQPSQPVTDRQSAYLGDIGTDRLEDREPETLSTD